MPTFRFLPARLFRCSIKSLFVVTSCIALLLWLELQFDLFSQSSTRGLGTTELILAVPLLILLTLRVVKRN